MDWSFFWTLTLQILIWMVVLGFPTYLLIGALSGSVVRGAIGAIIATASRVATAIQAEREKKIL